MVLTITKLKMWKNPGYTRGCVEIPPVASKKLPTPDYTSGAGETLRPRKNSTLTALELPLDYTTLFNMSYMYIEASDGSGSIALFGWIDSIEQLATSEPNVLIRWGVDWWRSYSDKVVWGIGRITRCADATLRRPPTIQPRYNVFTKYTTIKDSYEEQWIIIAFEDTTGGGDTLCKIGVAPAGKRFFGHTPENVLTGPTINDCYNGLLDEKLGIDPTTISGVWISPICPLDTVTIRTDGGGDYYDLSSSVAGNSKAKGTIGVAWANQNSIASAKITLPLTTDTADDLRSYGVTDFQGNLVGAFPWQSVGATDPGYIQVNLEVGSVSANLILRQKQTKFYAVTDMDLAGAGGCMIKIPLPTVPVNSNARSSYIYSGQRQAETETAKVQQDQKFVNNLLGVGGGAITGGVGGAMAGGGPGAIIGATVGTGVSLGTAFIGNELDTIYRDRLQDITDKAHCNQSSQLMLGSEGLTWTKMCPQPYIVRIDADAVTKSEYANMVTNNGYSTEFFASPSTLISTGGPIQVTDLTITGNLPPSAKSSIKMMFEKGVRIVENNPSGVVP